MKTSYSGAEHVLSLTVVMIAFQPRVGCLGRGNRVTHRWRLGNRRLYRQLCQPLPPRRVDRIRRKGQVLWVDTAGMVILEGLPRCTVCSTLGSAIRQGFARAWWRLFEECEEMRGGRQSEKYVGPKIDEG